MKDTLHCSLRAVSFYRKNKSVSSPKELTDLFFVGLRLLYGEPNVNGTLVALLQNVDCPKSDAQVAAFTVSFGKSNLRENLVRE